MDILLQREIFTCLSKGGDLRTLCPEDVNGRINLRGISLAKPELIRRYSFAGSEVTELKQQYEFQNVKWQDLDFTGSKLESMRITGSQITNCIFEDCKLNDLRMWSTEVSRVSLRGASIKDSSLGGGLDSKRNIFSFVDFSKADLRGTGFSPALFEDCVFGNAKLANIDFQESAFANCRFEGLLKDVIFWGDRPKKGRFPPNSMINADFEKATLRAVEFRGLTLESVRLPHNAEHIVIKNYESRLREVVESLRNRNDQDAQLLIAFLEIELKWAIKGQVQGVINIRDLEDTVGTENAGRLISLLLAD